MVFWFILILVQIKTNILKYLNSYYVYNGRNNLNNSSTTEAEYML